MSIPYSRYIIGSIPWYGVLITAGVLTALLLCIHEEKRQKLPPDTIIDLAFWAIPLGIAGARIYYAIFNWQALLTIHWASFASGRAGSPFMAR